MNTLLDWLAAVLLFLGLAAAPIPAPDAPTEPAPQGGGASDPDG